MSRVKEINVKNRTNYFFDDTIIIKYLEPNKIKISEMSYKNILICYIGYMTFKDLSYVKINSGNPLYPNIDQINGFIEESNGDRYLTLVATDESKHTKMYKELWDRTKNIIRLMTNNSDIYDEKYMKIKFNSDDYLLWNFVTW